MRSGATAGCSTALAAFGTSSRFRTTPLWMMDSGGCWTEYWGTTKALSGLSGWSGGFPSEGATSSVVTTSRVPNSVRRNLRLLPGRLAMPSFHSMAWMGSKSASCVPPSAAMAGTGAAAGVDGAVGMDGVTGMVDTMMGAPADTGHDTVPVMEPATDASTVGGTLVVVITEAEAGTAVSAAVVPLDIDTEVGVEAGTETCTEFAIEMGMDTGMEVGVEPGPEVDIVTGTAVDMETGRDIEAGTVVAMVVAISVGPDMEAVTPVGGAESGAMVTDEGSTTGIGVATDDTVSRGGCPLGAEVSTPARSVPNVAP